ncbi:diacylglycerol/lipid kinase family protein [Virgibacillus kimchii]
MSGFERALFLYNSKAGSDGIEQKLAKTLPVLAKKIKSITIIQTASIEEAQAACVRFAEEIDLLIILGGDGTLHACINAVALLKRRPVIGVLPAGTANDFSRMLQIPQDLEQAAQTIAAGEVMPVDVGKANDSYFLNFWGIGLVAEASQNIDQAQKNSLGVLSYIMSTIRTVNEAEVFRYKITTEQHEHNGEAVMIIVLNGKFIGTTELPIPSIQLNDGMFDVLIIKESNLAAFRELLSMKNPMTDKESFTELEHFQVHKLTLNTDPQKDADMDGEVSGSTPNEIMLLPGHLKMVRGVGDANKW